MMEVVPVHVRVDRIIINYDDCKQGQLLWEAHGNSDSNTKVVMVENSKCFRLALIIPVEGAPVGLLVEVMLLDEAGGVRRVWVENVGRMDPLRGVAYCYLTMPLAAPQSPADDRLRVIVWQETRSIFDHTWMVRSAASLPPPLAKELVGEEAEPAFEFEPTQIELEESVISPRRPSEKVEPESQPVKEPVPRHSSQREASPFLDSFVDLSSSSSSPNGSPASTPASATSPAALSQRNDSVLSLSPSQEEPPPSTTLLHQVGTLLYSSRLGQMVGRRAIRSESHAKTAFACLPLWLLGIKYDLKEMHASQTGNGPEYHRLIWCKNQCSDVISHVACDKANVVLLLPGEAYEQLLEQLADWARTHFPGLKVERSTEHSLQLGSVLYRVQRVLHRLRGEHLCLLEAHHGRDALVLAESLLSLLTWYPAFVEPVLRQVSFDPASHDYQPGLLPWMRKQSASKPRNEAIVSEIWCPLVGDWIEGQFVVVGEEAEREGEGQQPQQQQQLMWLHPDGTESFMAKEPCRQVDGLVQVGPVWLRGPITERLTMTAAQPADTQLAIQPALNETNSPSVNALLIQEFMQDALSRFWFTYRKDMARIGNTLFTTDLGWGCMLRTGQSMMAEALSRLYFGRGWRLHCLGSDAEMMSDYMEV